MNILPNDILIRETSNGSIVWVSQRLVVEVCEVSDEWVRTVKRRYKQSLPASWRTVSDQREFFLGDNGKSWRWGRRNGQYYYDVDSIPNRTPCHYRDRLPSKDALIALVDESRLRSSRERQTELRRLINEQVLRLVDNRDVFYYMTYMVGDRRVFNKDKAKEMSLSVAWCKYLKRALATGEYKGIGFASQDDFLSMCAEILSRENLEGFKVKTAASVRKKIYQAPGDHSELHHYLVSQKYGNDNPRKLGKYQMVDCETGEIFRFDEHQAIILNYWLNPGGSTKGTKVELWEDYCRDMGELGKDPVSYSTFTHYTNTWATKMPSAKERHGKDHFKNTYKTYVPARKLEYANSLWASDGSGVVPYRYQDHHGKWRMMKLYTMLVSDVASKCIIGYSTSRRGQHIENYAMLRKAMGMALKANGKTEVMDFISDNHGAYTSAESKEFLQLACRNYRTIAPGNSQANPSETIFRLFKRRFKRYFNLPETSWSAKSLESMANPDYYDIMSLPTYTEAIGKLETAIGEWNATPMTNGVTPAQWFTTVKNPEAVQYDDRLLRMLTGEVSNIDISYMRGFVDVQRGTDRYKFEIPNVADVIGLIAGYMGYNSSVPVTVYWDNEMADIYTRDGLYMFSCTNARLASKSASEADHDTLAALGHNQRRADTMERIADDWVTDVEAAKASLSPHYAFNIGSDGSAKEDYNAFREDISAAQYNKALSKRQTKEQRAETREKAKDKKAIENAALEYQRSKISDITKYK